MTDTAFTWLTVHPDHWPRQQLHGHQTCKLCQRELAVEGVLCTNARGAWEHLECATEVYRKVHEVRDGRGPEQRGRQRDLVEALHAHGRLSEVTFTREGRGQHERYGWRISLT